MRSVILVLLTLCAYAPSYPAQMFKVSDLHYEGELLSYRVEDLDNDGLKDILVLSKWPAGKHRSVRRLSLYFQTENGFAPEPAQTFRMEPEIIIFDIGDVEGDRRKELVYFAGAGLFTYALADSGFVLAGQKLMAVSSLFMLPGDNTAISLDFVRDVNADGIDELLIPGIREVGIYYRDGDGGWLKTSLPLPAEATFSGFFSPRSSLGHRAVATYSMPDLLFEDFDADRRNDLVAVYRDSLVVFLQDASRRFATVPFCRIPLHFGDLWRGQKIQRTRIAGKSVVNYLMRITDLDGDGLLDAVAVHRSTRKSLMNPDTDVRIFFLRADSAGVRRIFYFKEEPDQIVRPGGTQLVLDVHDFNHDGRQDLLLPVARVGLGNIIRMMITKSVELQAETYLLDEHRRYPDKPDQKNRLLMRFTYRGGATSPVYELADFDGDGYLDIMSSKEERTLLVVRGRKDRGFSSGVGASFDVSIPQNGELVSAMQLNRDSKADVIINYHESNPRNPGLGQTLRVLLSN